MMLNGKLQEKRVVSSFFRWEMGMILSFLLLLMGNINAQCPNGEELVFNENVGVPGGGDNSGNGVAGPLYGWNASNYQNYAGGNQAKMYNSPGGYIYRQLTGLELDGGATYTFTVTITTATANPIIIYFSSSQSPTGAAPIGSKTNISTTGNHSFEFVAPTSGGPYYVGVGIDPSQPYNELVITHFKLEKCFPSLPDITITPESLAEFNTCFEHPSDHQTVTVSGIKLDEDITVTVPPGYEYSIDGGSWTTTALIPQTDGNVNTTLRIRLQQGLADNDYDGTIYFAADPADTESITLNGKVAPGALSATPASITGLNYVVTGPSAPKSVTIGGPCFSGSVEVTPPADFEISTSSGGTYQTTPLTITSGESVYVRLQNGLTGTPGGILYSGDLTCVAGASNVTVPLSGTVTTKTPETYYARTTNGNWSNTAIWQVGGNCGGGGTAATTPPTAVDNVFVCEGRSVNVDGDFSCNNLTLQGGNGNLIFTVNNGGTLTVVNGLTSTTSNQSNRIILENNAILNVGQDLTTTGRNGANNFTVGNNVKVTVGRNFIAESPESNMDINVGTNTTFSVTGNFTMMGKNNGNIFSIGANTQVTVGGNFSATGTESAMNVPVSSGASLTVNGNFYMAGKNGASTLTVDGTVAVGGEFRGNDNNDRRFSVAGYGTLKIGGNLEYGNAINGDWNTGGLTLEMTGCNQNINIGKAISVGTFIQSATCPARYTKSGSTLTIGLYDQNCNPVRLAANTAGTAYANGFAGNFDNVIRDICTPTIYTTSNLEQFFTCSADPSAYQTFTVRARALEEVLTITPPEGYEISKTGNAPWYGYDDLPKLAFTTENEYGDISSKTVYVRLAAGSLEGLISGDIEIESANADTKYITLNGEVGAPFEMSASVSSISGIYYWQDTGAPNEPQSFMLMGSCPSDGDIKVQAPTGFRVSQDGLWFYSTINTFPRSGGIIYVRLDDGLSAGLYSGNITISNGSDEVNVSVAGEVLGNRCDGRFGYENWYSVGSFQACAVDVCRTVYEVNINFSSNDSHIMIYEGGDANNAVELTLGPGVGLRRENGGGGRVAYRNNAGSTGNFTYYLNTNTKPYTVTATIPAPALPESPVVSMGGDRYMGKCDPLSLTVFVCPNDLVAGYRWYRDDILIDGEENATLSIAKLEEEGHYKVEVLDAAAKVIGEKSISVVFVESTDLPRPTIPVAGGVIKLNELEHQINQGEKFTFAVTIPVSPRYDNYVLQCKSLEIDSFYTNVKTIKNADITGNNISFEYAPNEGMLYRLMAFNDGNNCSEHVSEPVLVRVVLNACKSESGSVRLYRNNFGYFEAGNIYAEDNNGKYDIKHTNSVSSIDYVDNTTEHCTQNLIERYWAPDPSGSLLKHIYAMCDQQDFGGGYCHPPYKSTGGFYRVEDGFFAILPTPGSGFGNCGEDDFWGFDSGLRDHTPLDDYPAGVGSQINYNETASGYKGAMLFVNMGPVKETPFYESKIDIDCKGANVMFSAYVNNAVKYAGSNIPCNVRLDIFRIDPDTNAEIKVKSISSGEIKRREETNMTAAQNYGWIVLNAQFRADEGEHLFRLVNYGESGGGNDLLLDDISINLCYPEIDICVLDSITGECVKEANVTSCTEATTYELCAEPRPVMENEVLVPVNIEDYISTPYYAYQYTRPDAVKGLLKYEDTGAESDTIRLRGKCINMELDEDFVGVTEVVVFVASEAQTIRNILADPNLKPSCENYFATDTIHINYSYYTPDPVIDSICPGDPVKLPVILENIIKWDLYDFTNKATPVLGMVLADITTGANETEKMRILKDSLLYKYEAYMTNPVNVAIDGTEREFFLTFETENECIFDGQSKGINHSDSISIKLKRMQQTDIDGTVENDPLDDYLNDNDMVKVCDSDNTGVHISITPVWQGDPKDYRWIWILKETGDTLYYDNVAHKNAGSFYIKKNSIHIKPSLSSVYEGTIIVKTDCECTQELEIPFKIYKDFTLDLAITDVVDGKLCLPATGDKDLTLTATLFPVSAPALTDPIDYYWYEVAQGGAETDLIDPNPVHIVTDPQTNAQQVTITGNGNYSYRVAATDGICHTTFGNASATSKDTAFVAGRPMTITMLTPDTIVCGGDDIFFRAMITNPRTDSTYTWRTDNTQLAKPVQPADGYVTYLYSNVTAEGTMYANINDEICAASLLEASAIYTVYQKVGKPTLDPIAEQCSDNLSATLTAHVTGDVELYKWYSVSSSNTATLLGTTAGNVNTYQVTLVKGDNRFKVEVTGKCAATDTDESDILTIKVVDPLTLDIIGVTDPCVGGDLMLAAHITSTPLRGDEASYIYTWEHNGGGTGTVIPPDKYEITNIRSSGTIKVSVHDNVCGGDPDSGELPYNTVTTLGTPNDDSKTVCEGSDNVFLDVTTIGATKYKWYNVTAGGNLVQEGPSGQYTVEGSSSLAPNSYTYRIELEGCEGETDETTATLIVKAPISISSLTPPNTTFCSESASNPVEFTATSNAVGEAEYVWQLLDDQRAQLLQSSEIGTSPVSKELPLPLGSGYVTVYVIDELCGASQPQEVQYDIDKGISIQLTSTMPNPQDGICQDDIDLKVTVTPPTADLSEYTWTLSDNGNTEPFDYTKLSFTRDISDGIPHIFTVTANAKVGNCRAENSLTALSNNLFRVSIGDDKIVCVNEEFELNAVTTPADVPGTTYIWKSLRGVQLETITPSQVKYPSTHSGQDTIVVIANTGGLNVCNNTDTIFVTVNDVLEIASRYEGEYDICHDEEFKDEILKFEILSGNPTKIYWSGDFGTDIEADVVPESKIQTKTVQVSGKQTYSVYVTDGVCEPSDPVEFPISITKRPEIELIAEPGVVEVNDNVKLTAVILHSDKEGNVREIYGKYYSWENDDDKNWKPETEENIIPAYMMRNEGEFVFYVKTDIGNCPLDASVNVVVIEPIPNIITPYNGNNKNDIFLGPKDGREGYDVEIYNRYQQVIHRGIGWDGKYRGQFAEPGTYFYRVIMKSGKVLKGTVEVAKF